MRAYIVILEAGGFGAGLTGKDVIIGLSAVFIFWTSVLALVSSRLVWHNLGLFLTWRDQDRETRVKMALWLSTPLLMATLTWQHAVALFNYAIVERIPFVSVLQILIYRPIMLLAMSLALWYAFNRVHPGADEHIDNLWWGFMVAGLLLGLGAALLSWWY